MPLKQIEHTILHLVVITPTQEMKRSPDKRNKLRISFQILSKSEYEVTDIGNTRLTTSPLLSHVTPSHSHSS